MSNNGSSSGNNSDESHSDSLLSPEEASAVRLNIKAASLSSAPSKPRYLVRIRGREMGRPWMAVVGACVAMLGLGAQSSWGTMSIFVSDPGMLRGVPSTQTIWAYATAGMMAPASMMVAPMLHKSVGFAVTAAIGAVVAGGGLMLMAFATQLWHLIATFGVLFGLGNGLLYVSCIIAAQSWYPKRRGLIGGLVLGIFAVSAFMYNMIGRALGNPNNIATRAPEDAEAAAAWRVLYHKEMSEHVPVAYTTIGAITLGLGVIGSVFVHRAPVEQSPGFQPEKRHSGYTVVSQLDAEKGTACEMGDLKAASVAPELANSPALNITPRCSYDDEVNAKMSLDRDRASVDLNALREQWRRQMQQARTPINATSSTPTPSVTPARTPTPSLQREEAREKLQTVVADEFEMTPLQMLRTPQFWMLYVVESFGVTATLLVLGSFAEFARREATFDAPFALVGGLAALSNAGGRLSWGALADIIDYRRTYVCILTLVTALLGAYYETRHNMLLWGVVTCMIWFCYGGLLSLLPTAVADTFGAQNQSKNYSVVNTSLAIGSLVQALLLTALLEILGSYRSLFWIAAGLTLFGDVLMFAYKPPGRGRWFAIWQSSKRPN